MESTPNIAQVGALLGDNARAKMLSSLMSGKALTASELAAVAGITAQTATSHLAKLRAGCLITERKQGRHKYFAIANEEVAILLESLTSLTAGINTKRIYTGPKDEGMRIARVCYNHLAGTKGVQLYDSLIRMRYLRLNSGNLLLSKKGERFMEDFGIDIQALRKSRTPLCRECLDWSERRSHLAGSLGRALLTQFEINKWIKRDRASRTVTFTRKGETSFNTMFVPTST